MNKPTDADFNKVFKELEVMQGVLVGMVNFLLKESKPVQVNADLSDTEKYELLNFFRCPDCHGPNFLKGPEGGLSTNIKCSDCGSQFNISPPFFAGRI